MQKKKVVLGSRLIENGVITDEQLIEALSYQRDFEKEQGRYIKLGTALVNLGFCSEDDIANALSQNTGYQFISLNKQPIDMKAANLITPEIAKKYKALPIGFSGEKLLLAMQNPNDLIALDDFKMITGRDIISVIVSDDELSASIEQFSNLSSEVDNVQDEENSDKEIVVDEDDGSDKPAVILCNQIINSAVRMGASDIHIEPLEKYFRVRFRIDGVLHETMQQPTSKFPSLVSRVKIISEIDIAERRIPQDGRATVKVDDQIVDIRVATLPSAYGEKITMRLLFRDSRVITIEDLGFPSYHKQKFMNALNLPYGFILVTGPTGSGKSTTLYASLEHLNSIEKNIITLEDPIERRMSGLNQVQMNQRAGMTFSSGLRSILRSDPDIVMVGEIRDAETAKIAVEAALTGHLVLSTLHTNDSAGAVTRLGEMGVEPFLTSSSLVGVVAQRLVRVLCPKCKEEYELSRKEILDLAPDFPLESDQEKVTLYRPKGCIRCNNTGFKGRLGVYEFLPITDEIRQMVLARKSNHDIKQMAIDQGMVTLRGDGLNKVKDGITSMEEMLRVIV